MIYGTTAQAVSRKLSRPRHLDAVQAASAGRANVSSAGHDLTNIHVRHFVIHVPQACGKSVQEKYGVCVAAPAVMFIQGEERCIKVCDAIILWQKFHRTKVREILTVVRRVRFDVQKSRSRNQRLAILDRDRHIIRIVFVASDVGTKLNSTFLGTACRSTNPRTCRDTRQRVSGKRAASYTAPKSLRPAGLEPRSSQRARLIREATNLHLLPYAMSSSRFGDKALIGCCARYLRLLPAAAFRYVDTDRGRSSVVEHQLPKLSVVGSIPIARSNLRCFAASVGMPT